MSPAGPRSGPRSHRTYNLDRVIAAVRAHGAVTRADLERTTELSRATVAALVARLIDDGTLRELPAAGETRPGAGPGRPPARLVLTESAGLVAGIAFSHGDLRVAAATLSGDVIAERHVHLVVDNSVAAALDSAADNFRAVLDESGHTEEDVSCVVVGLPAPLDRRTGRVMVNNVLPGWVDLDPTGGLEGRVHRPVFLENAVNLGVLGEMTYGAGAGLRDLVFVKVSTGVGAGLIFDGRLYRGTTGYAGELGHVQIEANGRVCRCGSRGCLETLVSTPHIIAALQPMHADPLTPADVVRLLEAGDSGAVRVVGDVGRTIGRSLADMCNVLNPEVVIVGGELSLPGGALTDGISEAITRYAQPGVAQALTVTTAALGSRAELLGAIALAVQRTGAPAPPT
ncbi:ROK family transcriptional regulator [Actinomadura darangshiensis]|uniref:ROK family transcriptional regulator n=1 Tax=Actinomadura darangshiensis TaxID=705336 RepID=A0A4R5B6R2_9ACTN|nr:ROK family transcriptional regulator [Actinomadura darangshiensis]TDD80330.1 ROK family transcriptional regulator [Actinomadura darangshiensis]